ncbi:hypothetical protein LHV13_03085 [Ferrovum sp. PN-J185]|uniref:type II secretion system protein N n=1 Tax=Ferrovum sp. PN-J185 TaxID=1356306 RepID=UPI000796DD1B|nr:type II secretion system protein N [Ferrovum sp. PN-J185]KXW56492.1 hypothetical protein FV185_04410 [Ferrovum sp. PN-J185]MCC6068159.1 hypothetical protein [Ferrovum sp. PN-J185]MDE1891728.1 hypothetical protein [Betaproteobacteria bacterium]MDE2056430.1 hypothetical protein [Betaproteobacteria bacterium]
MLKNWQLTPKQDNFKYLLQLISLFILAGTIGHWISILLAPSPLPVPIHTIEKNTNPIYNDAKSVFIGPSLLNANLSLKGVIASVNHDGIAVISINNGLAHPYREGYEISSGILLKEVADNHIVIERQGRSETLILNSKTSIPNGLSIEHH